MELEKLMQALNGLKVETGSLACLGCGHEHNCATEGCAIIREALEALKVQQEVFNEDAILKLAERRPWVWRPATCVFWSKTHAREPEGRRDATGAIPKIPENATV